MDCYENDLSSAEIEFVEVPGVFEFDGMYSSHGASLDINQTAIIALS